MGCATTLKRAPKESAQPLPVLEVLTLAVERAPVELDELMLVAFGFRSPLLARSGGGPARAAP